MLKLNNHIQHIKRQGKKKMKNKLTYYWKCLNGKYGDDLMMTSRAPIIIIAFLIAYLMKK